MGQFILNGRNYSGLTYAQGVFIDVNNVIAQGAYTGSFSYTATQDCYFYGEIANDRDNAGTITVDGVAVYTIYDSTVSQSGIAIPLKKGQVIALTTTFSQAATSYKVYGIQEGSPVTFLSEYASACYDTTEREVGCWIDGKPLYQKTVHLSSVASGTAYSHGIANVENISVVNILAKRNTGWFSSGHIFEDSPSNVTESFSVIPNATYLYAYLYGCTISDAYITVQYTKTTDVAGSGKLTPTAMPTVHYDTNEQVIGTFLGKTLYQRTWDISSGILVSYNGWTDTSIDSTNMENIVSVKATHPDGTCYEGIMADPTRQNHTVVGLQTTRNGNDARVQYVTLQYTKSS